MAFSCLVFLSIKINLLPKDCERRNEKEAVECVVGYMFADDNDSTFHKREIFTTRS